jgi:hypothetical protein
MVQDSPKHIESTRKGEAGAAIATGGDGGGVPRVRREQAATEKPERRRE